MLQKLSIDKEALIGYYSQNLQIVSPKAPDYPLALLIYKTAEDIEKVMGKGCGIALGINAQEISEIHTYADVSLDGISKVATELADKIGKYTNATGKEQYRIFHYLMTYILSVLAKANTENGTFDSWSLKSLFTIVMKVNDEFMEENLEHFQEVFDKIDEIRKLKDELTDELDNLDDY